jgi:hypothetical protein
VLKHRSARQSLASKTVEEEGAEGTEGSPLSLFAPVLWFGCGYAVLGSFAAISAPQLLYYLLFVYWTELSEHDIWKNRFPRSG